MEENRNISYLVKVSIPEYLVLRWEIESPFQALQ